MIAVDTSAVIAILLHEPEAVIFSKIVLSRLCLLSAPTLVECQSVVQRRRDIDGRQSLDMFLRKIKVEIVPFDQSQAETGTDAYAQFGKGSGHPAQLNLGDTFSYALAKTRNIPLLFKGNDFIHTDIIPAIPQAA